MPDQTTQPTQTAQVPQSTASDAVPNMASSTVPMFSPDGKLGDVPADRVHDAVNSGFKLGQDLISPDGQAGTVPLERVHDALKSGFKLKGGSSSAAPGAFQTKPGGTVQNVNQLEQETQPGQEDTGFWAGLGDNLWGSIHGLYQLAKAQTHHEAETFGKPIQDVSEGDYKQGAYDALKAVIAPDLSGPVQQTVRNMAANSLRNAKDSVVNTVGAAGKAVTGDFTGAVRQYGQAVKDTVGMIPGVGPAIVKTGEDLNAKPRYGTGEAVGNILQIAGPEALSESGLVGKAGKYLEENAPKSVNGLLRATNPKSFLYGKNPGRAFIDENIKPSWNLSTLDEQLSAAGDSLHQQVLDNMASSQVKDIDVVPVVKNTADGFLNEIAGTQGLKNRAAVVKAIKDYRDELLSLHDKDGNILATPTRTKFGPQEVAELKKDIGQSSRWDINNDPITEHYLNQFQHSLYGQLNNLVEQAAPGTRALNARYANVIEAQRLLGKRIPREEMTNVGLSRLGRKVEWAGAVEAAATQHPVVAAALAGNRAVRSTPGRVMLAQTKDAAGKAIQGVQESGAVARTPQAATITGQSDERHGDWVSVQFADNSIHQIHPGDVDQALKQNPGAKVLSDE